MTFVPEDNTTAARARFEATVASLKDMQKAGWIGLEVAGEQKRRRGRHRETKRGAAARCTSQRREALRLLGEA